MLSSISASNNRSSFGNQCRSLHVKGLRVLFFQVQHISLHLSTFQALFFDVHRGVYTEDFVWLAQVELKPAAGSLVCSLERLSFHLTLPELRAPSASLNPVSEDTLALRGATKSYCPGRGW